MFELKTFSFFLFLFPLIIQAQEYPFDNPSFELDSVENSLPAWYALDIKGETPPDVQPCCFNVIKPAADGNNYLGMVARDNGTWEGVYQKLTTRLKADRCYEFTVKLSQSFIYESVARSSGEQENYTRPLRLQLWSSNKAGQHIEKLYLTEAIDHADWRSYTIKIEPREDVISINFEAFYNGAIPYNGHLLMDDLSPIKECSCDNNSSSTDILTDKELLSMSSDLPSNFINLRNFFYYERMHFLNKDSNHLDLSIKKATDFPAYLEATVFDLYRWAELAKQSEKAKIRIRQGIHPKTGLNFEAEILQSLIVYYLNLFGLEESKISFSYVEQRKYGRNKYPAILSLYID